MMNKSLNIQLHLQSTVPVFKGKHGSPVKPEIRGKYLIIKEILYFLIIQILIFGKEQLHDLHAALLAQVKLSICMGILSLIDCSTTQRIVGIMLI